MAGERKHGADRRVVMLCILGCALFSLSCVSSSVLVEVSRTDDGRHLVGRSLSLEFDKNVWDRLDAGDRSGIAAFPSTLQQQGWKVQSSEGGRVIHASRDPVAVEALPGQGWTMHQTQVGAGRLITATLPGMGIFGTASKDPTQDFYKDIRIIIDETDPHDAHYTYQTTVVIPAATAQGSAAVLTPAAGPGDGVAHSTTEWATMVDQSIEASPQYRKYAQALKNAGPPRFVLGVSLPGDIRSATVNGAAEGDVSGPGVRWILPLQQAGTYHLEAAAQQRPPLRLSALVLAVDGVQEGVLRYGDTARVTASVRAEDPQTRQQQAAGPITVKLFYDDTLMDQGTGDGTGEITLRFTPPGTTPDGRSKHHYRVEASKPGLETVADTRDLEVHRGVEPLVVTLDGVDGVHDVGEVVTLSGRVTTAGSMGLSGGGVEAAISTADGAAVGHTGADGAFSLQLTIPQMDFSIVHDIWTVVVVADPGDPHRFETGSAGTRILTRAHGRLQVSAAMGRAVYAPTEQAALAGTVAMDGVPRAATLEILADGKQVIGSTQSGADGRFEFSFLPATLPKVGVPGTAPGGGPAPPVLPFLDFPVHLLTVRASTATGTLPGQTSVYFTVSAPDDACHAESMWVSALAGNPAAALSREESLASLISGQQMSPASPLQVGSGVSEGMEVQTGPGERATFALLLDPGPDTQAAIALAGNATLDVGRLCRDRTGQLHVVLRANAPGQVLVRWPPGAHADLRLVTPRGTVADIHTRYFVTVAADGTTAVATLEGAVRLADAGGAGVDIPAGQAVVVRPGGAPASIRPAAQAGHVDPHLVAMLDGTALPSGARSGQAPAAGPAPQAPAAPAAVLDLHPLTAPPALVLYAAIGIAAGGLLAWGRVRRTRRARVARQRASAGPPRGPGGPPAAQPWPPPGAWPRACACGMPASDPRQRFCHRCGRPLPP